jgi:VWFA-related protein
MALLASASGPSANPAERDQNPPPPGTIRVQAPSVVVDVIVTDKKGQPATGLTAADFKLFENNEEQKIVTFVPPVRTTEKPSQENIAAKAPAAPATQSEREARSVAEIHFITLVLDLGDLQPGHIKRACDAAAAYVRKDVAAEDLVAVYFVDQSLHLALAFTFDKRQVLATFNRLSGHTSEGRITTTQRQETQQEIDELNQEIYGLNASSALGVGATAAAPATGSQAAGGSAAGAQAAEIQMEKIELATLMKFLWSQSTVQARAVLLALRAIAQAYQSLPGRKNVVLFSEGFLHSPDALPELQAVIDAANRANVAFYVIDAAGLAAESYDASNAMPPDPGGTRDAYRMANWGQYDQVSTGLHKFDWAAHLGVDSLHEDLGEVASATGGLMMKNQNDLLVGLESVDRDLREFYTLVYQPSDTNYDGAFRHIKVETLKPNVHLRYRQGYWAIPPGEEAMMTPAAAQLIAAIQNGSLKPAFAPDLNAALLVARDGKFEAPVRVSLPGRLVNLEHAGDRYGGVATLVLVARDHAGGLAAVHQRSLTFDLTKKQWDEFRRGKVDINARLALSQMEPIEVQAILQLPGGTVAVGNRQVAVSNGDGGFMLSGLLLSNDIEPAQGTADPADALRGENFQIFLPTQPRFARSDKLTVYFGIVRREAAPVERLRVSYALKSGVDIVADLGAEDVAWGPSQDRLLVLKQFDLNALKGGQYTLEVALQNPAAHLSTSASAEFSIE